MCVYTYTPIPLPLPIIKPISIPISIPIPIPTHIHMMHKQTQHYNEPATQTTPSSSARLARAASEEASRPRGNKEPRTEEIEEA